MAHKKNKVVFLLRYESSIKTISSIKTVLKIKVSASTVVILVQFFIKGKHCQSSRCWQVSYFNFSILVCDVNSKVLAVSSAVAR